MEIRRINNSEIQTFLRCKRKWMMSYYLGLTSKEDEENTNLIVGTLVHAGLEEYYRGGDILKPIRDAKVDLEEKWLANPVPAVPGEPAELLTDNNIELSEIMLEGYKEWIEESGFDANLQITGVEEELEISLGEINGREVRLHGRVDARFLDPDGNTVLLDHKTTGNFADLADRRIRLNQQLMTYAILLRMAKGELVHGAALNMLRKVKRTARAKPPFYDRVFVYFNTEQLRSHYAHMQSVVEDILVLEDKLRLDPALTNAAAYPTVDKDCTWKCPFLALCPMFDDGSNIEGAVKGMFKAKEAA